MNHSNLKVAYSCNEAYVSHTGISIISLLENNKEFKEIHVYFIEKDVSNESCEILRKIVERYNRKLIVVPFLDICYNLKTNQLGRHIETVYSKLFFGNILEVDKLLYLDSDTIINGSLSDVWEQDLGDNYFGCVKTITRDYNKALGLNESEVFYNDGIAMVNTAKLRDDKMEAKFLKFIAKYDGNPPVLSEGVINVVCRDRILAIHPKYNFSPMFYMASNKKIQKIVKSKDYFTEDELNESRKNPIIIHYLAGWFLRPWEVDCTHPLKDKYLMFKSLSPWKDVPLVKKKKTMSAKKMEIGYKYLPLWAFNFLRKLKSKIS